MSKKFDAVIIGGGPGGYSAAIGIAQLGGKACIVEKKWLGGVCANIGCIPTKALVSIAKSISTLKKSQRIGITAREISYDIEKIKTWMNSRVKKSVRGVENVLASNGVEVVKGFGYIDTPEKVVVYDSEQKAKITQILETKNIIVATGSKPMWPKSILQDKDISTTETIFELEDIPKEFLIIGGGYIGLEFACIFNALGSKVCIVEKLPHILNTEEQEISEEITRLMKRAGIDILTNTDFGTIKLKADKVLLAVGRQANFDKEELNKLGIEFDKKGINTDLLMKTNVRGIYAVGDVNGKLLLAHVAISEGIVAAENIMGKKREIDYSNVPNCIFSIPEIASIGKREGKSGKFPFIANGKASTMDETDGFVKVYLSAGKLVGASIIGPQASTLIAVVQALLGKDAKEIKKMIVAHPTLPEAIFEAISDAE